MYNLPQPPYLLIAVGLLMSLSSGVVFAKLIKQLVKKWSENPATCTACELEAACSLVQCGQCKKFAYSFECTAHDADDSRICNACVTTRVCFYCKMEKPKQQFTQKSYN